MSFVRIISVGAVFLLLLSCSRPTGWTGEEKQLIMGDGEVMRVLSVDDSLDYRLLRTPSTDIPVSLLKGEVAQTLFSRLISTVSYPSNDGVGIAAPQVGVLRRVVAVQRFDKEGEPFEIYPNIRILEKRGEKINGPEGCLSVPLRRGDVPRNREIVISYTSPRTLADTSEVVNGFTAVIFQHECDHLDGILYTYHIWEADSMWTVRNSGADADVFYIVSTDVVSSRGNDGKECFNAVLSKEERSNLYAEMDFVSRRLFDTDTTSGRKPVFNFFSPYYHQVTMNGFFSDSLSFAESYERARLEIFEAFDYYVNHHNQGRPFILAGFSQGAILVRELLRKMSDEQYSRLIAAYVIGYGLSAEDVSHPHIKPATDAYDTGVCISFNTVKDTSSIWPLVYNESVSCINPVNWKTDSTPGFVCCGSDSVAVFLDEIRHVLLAPEFKGEMSVPFWPAGCLHHEDLIIYSSSIRDNATERKSRYLMP